MNNNTINTADLLNYIANAQTEKAVSLDEGFNMFMNYKSIHNRKGTCDAYVDTFKNIMNYLSNHHIVFTNQITTDVIDKYVLERVTQVKPITVNKEIGSLTAMMNYLLKKEIISKIHYSFEKLKTTKTKIESIEEKDVIKCLDHFKNSKELSKFKLAFLLILTTGVRTTELINIKNQNIDMVHNRILLDFTKNGKPRYLYIVEQVHDLIDEVMSSSTYLFNDENGKQMTDNSIRLFFKHLKTKLHIEVLSPHKLRHFYATNLYKKSLDIYLVSKLLGHSDTKTTEIYLDVNEHDNQLKNEHYNPLNYLTF